MISKATDTHSEYVIIIAFQRQQLLRLNRLNFTPYVHCRVLLRSSVTTRMKSGDTSPKWEHRAIPNTKKSRTKQAQKTRNQPLRPDFGFSLHGVG